MARIVLYCSEVVGESMTGPAIRCCEFAKILSRTHDVVLSTPNSPEVSFEGFVIKPRTQFPLSKIISEADLILAQLVSPRMAWLAKRHGVRIIVDAYDPMPLENLELFQSFPKWVQRYKNTRIVNNTRFSLQMADGILCANTKQRDLWIGALMSLGRITPQAYAQDKTLNHLISKVPFGLPATRPEKNGEGFRKKFNLSESDKVLLWGGGIWNWLDPLSLIKAIHKLVQDGFPIHLVFMGLKHPNPKALAMKMATEAMQLAKELGLLDKYVFFNYGWTPYQQRQNFLLEANIAVSIHSEHLETQYSFRTRMLDYIWAGVPIIATEGDSFAELIKTKELGRVVPYGDIPAIASAIKQLLEPSTKEKIQANLANIRSEYYWDRVVESLLRMIDNLSPQPKQTVSIISHMCRAYGPTAIIQEILCRLRGLK